MALRQRLRAAYEGFRNPPGRVDVGEYRSPLLPEDHRDRCALLLLYYQGEIYRRVNAELRSLVAGRDASGIRELENPTEQVVEFHASHLFPGTLPDALPLIAEDKLKAAIEQIWTWSNWGQKKQTYARWLPLYGDAFLKAAVSSSGKPYLQLIHPTKVSDFEKDERGNLTYMLLQSQEEVESRTVVYSEEWSKEDGVRRTWYANSSGDDYDARLRSFSGAQETGVTGLGDLGIDFVPFVHAPFVPDLEDTDSWGVSAVSAKFSQIDEINRAVTALHDRFFRYGKPDIALLAGESGRGAPKGERIVGRGQESLPGPERSRPLNGQRVNVDRAQEVYSFPGMSHMEYMIPNIPYSDGLAMIDARQKALAGSLAELRFYSDVDSGDPSGIARRIRLAPAVSRGLEARGNAEDAMIRAQKMCLTLGIRSGAFSDIGSFEQGDFEHHFKERDILAVSEEEAAGTWTLRLENAEREIALGRPQEDVFKELGWDATRMDAPAALGNFAGQDALSQARSVLGGTSGGNQTG